MGVYNIHGSDIDNGVYSIRGSKLSQAYDIHGNPLIDVHPDPEPTVQIISNQATGVESGFSFWLNNPGYNYPLYDVVDFLSDSYSYQSFCYDPRNNCFYKFDASTTVKVYNSSFQRIDTINLPQSAGHNNDTCYIDGKVYMPGGEESSGVYVWDITNNTVSVLSVSGVASPTTSARRIMAGICRVPSEDGYLYLVYIDSQADDISHEHGDKLSIYKYSIANGTANLIVDYDWDCVFVQGAEVSNGILYVACNTATTGSASNYKGITLKAYRTDNWLPLLSLYASGVFEQEGMCMYPYSSNPELMIGIGHYGTLAKAVRYSVPYRLVYPN